MRTENRLLAKAGKGDLDAFEKLVTDYEKHIYNISYRILGNAEDAKDASQEALIKIFKNIGKCREITALKSWISTIASNTCIDILRRRKPELSFESEIETEDGRFALQIPSGEPTPEEHLVYKELRSDITDALARLPDVYRVLIVMRDIQGLSYNEIAEATGAQLGTVKSRLSRARNNLRALLENEEQKNDTFV